MEIALQLITVHTIIAGSRFINDTFKHEDTYILCQWRLLIEPNLLSTSTINYISKPSKLFSYEQMALGRTILNIFIVMDYGCQKCIW